MVKTEVESRIIILKDALLSVQTKIKNNNHSDEVYSTGKDCLKSLQQISDETPMTTDILQSTEIGIVVNKFKKTISKHSEDEDEGIRTDKKELSDLATKLLDTWRNRIRMSDLREKLHTIHNKWKESESTEYSNEDIKLANNSLKKLGEMEMTCTILSQKPKIGSIVNKFQGYKETKLAAEALIAKWGRLAGQTTGFANEALMAFRKREKELKDKGQFKPDMVAFKNLRNKYLPSTKKHGHITGVPVGICLGGRGEAAILGIHQKILNGIDSVKDEACFAVCISGKYEDEDILDDDDDNDNNNKNGSGKENGGDDGTILYTGSGGQKNGRQVEDQEENVDNASLLKSERTGLPIRVLRRRNRRINGGKKGSYISEYCYDGLYKCTGSDYVKSSDGPMVYKFKLEPISGESERSSTTSHAVTSSSRPRSNTVSNSRRCVRDRIVSKMKKK